MFYFVPHLFEFSCSAFATTRQKQKSHKINDFAAFSFLDRVTKK